MSITDELRAWIERYTMSGERYRELLAIVDRIDAAHRSALEKVAAMVDAPDEIERRVKALEHLTEGMLLAESEMEERIGKLEAR